MAKSIREYYGETIAALAREDNSIVLLDADVSNSTRSCIFAAEYPDRFYNMGIAEQNMFATAAGLAAAGKTVFVNTFAVFASTIGLIATRGLICYADLNVKIAASYCGMSDALDGASHHATEDMSVMRALPRMQIAVPSDAASTRWLTKYAAEHRGPVYLRLSREVYPDVYQEDTSFQAEKGVVVKEGTDATVFACGIMVGKALEAARELEKEKLNVRVVDMMFIKPLDEELVLRCARETGAVVTAEEHSVLGGLGSAVSDVLSGEGIGVRHEFVGIKDTFTESGSYGELLAKYGLDAEAVAAAVRKAVAAKTMGKQAR